MSPWPENQNEPKAPDKNSDSNNSTVESGARTKICNSAVTDSDIPDPLVPEESIASLNMINSTSDNESAQDVPKTPNPVQDVSNSPKPVQDVLNPPKPVQDIPDTSKPIQDVPNTSKPEQDSQNTSKPVQDIPDTSKHLQDAPNTSKHLQDVPNTSKHLKDAPDSSKHLQDTPSTSKHLQDAPNSSKHPQDTPSTSKHLQDAPNTSKNLQDAPNTSKHLQDAPNTSKNLQDAPNTSKNLQDAPNTSKHLQDAPNTSKHLQDAPNSSKHPQDTPSTSKHLQDAPNTSKNLQDAPNTSKHLQDAPNSSKHPQDTPSTSKHLQDAPSTSKNLQDAPNTSKNLQDAPNTSKNLQDAPNTSKHLQDAPSTSKHVQDVPSTSKNLQDVPKPEEDIQPLQSTSKPSERKPVIDDLDDDGLKSLLEEAITYKSPKDKDTKSALFQNLLIEAEKKDDSEQSDDDGSGSQFQPLGLGRTRYGYAPPRKRLNRRDTDRQRGGGSLQNLSCGPKLANRVSVSARQREGGSLPTNVNQSCAADDNLYTSRATLQVSSPLESIPTPKPNPPAVMNGVEHAPLQLHSTYNSVKSVVGSETALKSGPSSEGTVQHVSTCFLPISPQQSVTLLRDTDLRQFATYTKDPTETKIKSFDENGNALATSNRVEAGTSERKAKRKKKNYRNIINAENIEGHRWDEDIDSLMKYINSGSNEEEKSHKSRQSASSGARATVHSKIKAQDECRKKRGAKELRKIQKSNSMEEISKTKLEDLTSPSEKSPEENNTRVKPKKQVTLDDNQLEASCWQTEEASTLSVSVEKLVIDTEDKKKVFEKKESFSDLQDADFHLVKKKQRKKKRPANNARPGCSKASNYGYHPNQGFPSHYRRSTTTVQQERVQPRRKSASSVPPSDKSDSSDLDSVHSLPVSSTTPKPTVGKTSTSGGSTPLASYADIARSMAAPPTPPPPPPAPPTPPPPPPVLPAAPSQPLRKDAMTDTDSDKMLLPVEEYPPLARKVECSDYFVEVTFKRGGRTEETIIVKPSVPSKNSSDVRVESEVKKEQSTSQKQAATDAAGASRRPPVILLNRSGRSSPKHPLDVTFGFDINQELLAESEPVTRQPYDHASTVNYIKAEWDEVMRLFNSNARSDRAESKQPQVQYYKP